MPRGHPYQCPILRLKFFADFEVLNTPSSQHFEEPLWLLKGLIRANLQQGYLPNILLLLPVINPPSHFEILDDVAAIENHVEIASTQSLEMLKATSY